LVLTFAVTLIFLQLKSRTALTRHTTFGSLSADMGTAMFLIHTVHPIYQKKDREKAELQSCNLPLQTLL